MSSERVEGMDRWRRSVLGTFACATLGRSSSLDKSTALLQDRKSDMKDSITFMRALFFLHEYRHYFIWAWALFWRFTCTLHCVHTVGEVKWRRIDSAPQNKLLGLLCDYDYRLCSCIPQRTKKCCNVSGYQSFVPVNEM